MTTGYNAGVLTGNQVSSVIQAPIDLCGNAISVLGFASAECEGGAGAVNGGGSAESMTSGFNAGVLTGNQVSNVVQVPISACGNAISVLGFADASCTGGAWAVNGGGTGGGSNAGGGSHHGGGSNHGGGYSSGGASGGYSSGGASGGYGSNAGAHGHGHSHGSGTKANGKVKGSHKAKTGNAGHAHRHGSDEHGAGHRNRGGYGAGHGTGNGGYSAGNNGGSYHGGGAGNGGSAADADGCGDMTTGYNAGILTGNQVSSVLQVPIDISGNAVSVLGFASGSSTGGAWAVNC
jgi:hypothetical protein